MRRQLMGVMLTALVLIGGVIRAEAAERTGSIRVMSDNGNEAVPGREVVLQFVGQPSPDGYILTDSFGGGLIRYEDDRSSSLAQWLAEIPGGERLEPVADTQSGAEFKNLPEGLYLLKQESVRPVMIAIPSEGLWDLTVTPQKKMVAVESPKTGQHPAPIIGAMGLVLTGMGLVFCFEKIKKK